MEERTIGPGMQYNRSQVEAMTTAVNAVYENGVFKPEEPVPLQDRARVRLIIESAPQAAQEDDDPTGWKTARRFIGLWKGAPEGEPIARDHDKYLYK